MLSTPGCEEGASVGHFGSPFLACSRIRPAGQRGTSFRVALGASLDLRERSLTGWKVGERGGGAGSLTSVVCLLAAAFYPRGGGFGFGSRTRVSM